jgi:hypothetical protein
MTCQGTRDARVRETLARIGPAVLNGGFSTFLAFCFLAISDSHIFKTFFKASTSMKSFSLHFYKHQLVKSSNTISHPNCLIKLHSATLLKIFQGLHQKTIYLKFIPFFSCDLSLSITKI